MSQFLVKQRTTRFAMIALVSLATVGTTGCRYNQCGLGISNCLEQCLSRKSAKHRAADAWDACPNRCASEDVRQGFIDGYCDVALGGRGCTPAVAPSRYWGWRYSGIEGQQAGAQWLQGFPLGALAAQGEGASYRVAALDVPTESEYRASSRQHMPKQQHGSQGSHDPGPDTIDHTIEMPAYLDNPSDASDAYEEPDTTDEPPVAPDTVKDALEDATDAMKKATDAAQFGGLKVQTITTSEGKSIKHLMTSEPARQIAPIKKQAVTSVATKITPLEKTVVTPSKVITPAKVVAPVQEVKEVVKETINKIPELSLEQNDEVFGFGIE